MSESTEKALMALLLPKKCSSKSSPLIFTKLPVPKPCLPSNKQGILFLFLSFQLNSHPLTTKWQHISRAKKQELLNCFPPLHQTYIKSKVGTPSPSHLSPPQTDPWVMVVDGSLRPIWAVWSNRINPLFSPSIPIKQNTSEVDAKKRSTIILLSP